MYFITRCARVWTRRRRGALHWGVFVLGWFGGLWYAFGDHDALAFCSWRICYWWWLSYLGGALLHVGDLVHDALVLGGSCLWSAIIGGWWWSLCWWLDGCFAWKVTWWRVCFDDLEPWLMEDWLGWCFGGLDDVLVDGGFGTLLLYMVQQWQFV